MNSKKFDEMVMYAAIACRDSKLSASRNAIEKKILKATPKVPPPTAQQRLFDESPGFALMPPKKKRIPVESKICGWTGQEWCDCPARKTKHWRDLVCEFYTEA